MSTLEFVFRLLAAVASGGAVGLERQINNKSAGFRTNTLVAMGASIYAVSYTHLDVYKRQAFKHSTIHTAILTARWRVYPTA